MWPRRSSCQRILLRQIRRVCGDRWSHKLIMATLRLRVANCSLRFYRNVKMHYVMQFDIGSEVILGHRHTFQGVGCMTCACFAVILESHGKPWGVKPHGRLGQLRSERLATLPRAAYRRSSLLRPLRGIKFPGRVHLGGRFPLRCFQRLSPPIIATRRCSWRHSRDTSGSSDSVLSY